MKFLNKIKGIQYILSEDGAPEFVVLPSAEFARIAETLEIESNPELMRSIERARKQTKKKKRLLSRSEVFNNL